MIVDAHVHLWSSRTNPPHHRSEPLGADELVRGMDAAGIDRAINCPAVWDPRANEIANEAARRYPDRIATMGWFELTPDGNSKGLARWMDQPGMLGLRFVLVDPLRRSWFEQGLLDWVWEGAQHYGIPVGLTVPGALPHLGMVASRFPGLQLVVDHMGAGAFGKAPEAFSHLPDLLGLASLPNVSVKASAAPGYAADPFPFRSVHPVLRDIVAAFGPQRVFWGTDITRLSCSWRDCVTMFAEHLPWLPDTALKDIMGDAVLRFLRWPVPDAGSRRGPDGRAR